MCIVQYVSDNHLEFASPVWSLWNVGDQEELEKMLQGATKMVAGLTTNQATCNRLEAGTRNCVAPGTV